MVLLTTVLCLTSCDALTDAMDEEYKEQGIFFSIETDSEGKEYAVANIYQMSESISIPRFYGFTTVKKVNLNI